MPGHVAFRDNDRDPWRDLRGGCQMLANEAKAYLHNWLT